MEAPQDVRKQGCAVGSASAEAALPAPIASVPVHAAEDDEAVARRLDLVGEQLEAMTKTERSNLAFDQPAGGLR